MATAVSLLIGHIGGAPFMRKIDRHLGAPRRSRVATILIVGALVGLAPAVSTYASTEQDLIRTMRAMSGALLQIQAYLDGKESQATATDNSVQLVTFAKSIPEKFPPGSELMDLPHKFDAAAPTWADLERFLDAQAKLVIETDKLLLAVRQGDKAAIAQQVADTRKNACGNCHDKFRD